MVMLKHTNRTDTASTLNRLADRDSNEARLENGVTHFRPFFENVDLLSGRTSTRKLVTLRHGKLVAPRVNSWLLAHLDENYHSAVGYKTAVMQILKSKQFWGKLS